LFEGRQRVRDRVVSLVDLRPTLEDLLGLPVTPAIDGASLLREPGGPDRAVYIETKLPFHSARCSPLYGLRRHRDKYVRGPEPEYFDLQADPDEVNNLHDAHRAPSEDLATRLARIMEGWAAGDGADVQRRTLSPEEADRLSSLGYVQVSAAADVEPGELPDPKAMMRANRKITEALKLSRSNRMPEALRLSQEAVRECPAPPDATHFLASLYERMGKPELAIAVLQQLLELNPQCGTALQLAEVLLRLGRYDEMEAALTKASALGPNNGFVHTLRADRYCLQGRLPEAIAEYEEAIRIDEHRAGIPARPQIEKLRKLMEGDQGPAP
jgi:tetratricopeptide (TPR) repeat protein